MEGAAAIEAQLPLWFWQWCPADEPRPDDPLPAPSPCGDGVVRTTANEAGA